MSPNSVRCVQDLYKAARARVLVWLPINCWCIHSKQHWTCLLSMAQAWARKVVAREGPPLLGRKGCFCLSFACQPVSGQQLMYCTGRPCSAMCPACRSGAIVVRACTCRAASVGLRHLITRCRPKSGEAGVTQGHCMAQRWSVRAPATKPRHRIQSAWQELNISMQGQALA